MGQSQLYRERRNALAAWLRDRFEPEPIDGDSEVPDAAYWRDASDLLKFLTANGLTITPIDEENQ